MKRITPLIFFFALAVFSHADTLKVKRFNVSMGLGSGDPNIEIPFSKRINDISIPVRHSISHMKSVDLGLDYCFNYSKKKSRFKNYAAVGLSFGLSSFNLTTYMNDYSSHGHFPYTYDLEPNQFSNDVYRYTFSIPFTYYISIGNFFVFQRLGIAATGFLGKKTIHYKERVSHSYPTTDPEYVTPENPSGWHWVTQPDTYIEHEDVLSFDNAFTPFSSTNIGYRIKNLVPFINADVTFINNTVHFKGGTYYLGPLLKYGAGIIWFFR